MTEKTRILKGIVAGMIIVLLAGACTAKRNLTQAPESKPLTENQMREYQYALTEATKQKLFGNFNQAAALYRKCIEVNPYSDVAHFQLSGIYMIGRDLEMAKKMNIQAADLAPNNYWYKVQLAQIFMMSQLPDSATYVYEDILERWPEKVEVKYELSRLYAETGSTKKAIKSLNEIEDEKGISEPVSMLKEQIYVKEGKYDLAIKELHNLIEADPENIRYIGILAELYTTLNRKEDAREAYRKIFEIEPENGIAQLSMAEFYRLDNNKEMQFEYLQMAFANESLPVDRKMGVVIDFLTNEQVFRDNEKDVDSLIVILSTMYPDDFRIKTAKADYLSKLEKYEEALAVYDEVLTEQKGNYFIWEQAIFIENILGNTENVYKKCADAIAIFPDKPFLYLFHGNAASQKNHNREAVRSLEKGLGYVENNIPLTVQFYSFLAEAWRNLENYDKSDEYFEKALEMEPDNIMILNNYGYYLALREDKLELAESMSKRTIESEPENPTYLDTYAWILYKAGKLNEAKEYIELALKHGGNEDADILEHYGDILSAMGNSSEALVFWKNAFELRPESDELERKIQEVENQ